MTGREYLAVVEVSLHAGRFFRVKELCLPLPAFQCQKVADQAMIGVHCGHLPARIQRGELGDVRKHGSRRRPSSSRLLLLLLVLLKIRGRSTKISLGVQKYQPRL